MDRVEEGKKKKKSERKGAKSSASRYILPKSHVEQGNLVEEISNLDGLFTAIPTSQKLLDGHGPVEPNLLNIGILFIVLYLHLERGIKAVS